MDRYITCDDGVSIPIEEGEVVAVYFPHPELSTIDIHKRIDNGLLLRKPRTEYLWIKSAFSFGTPFDLMYHDGVLSVFMSKSKATGRLWDRDFEVGVIAFSIPLEQITRAVDNQQFIESLSQDKKQGK